MQIEVKENRSLRIYEAEQTQNENDVTSFELIVPEKYQNFNKKVVFILPHGEKIWDIIEGNEYKINRAITKFRDVKVYIWLTKDTEDFRSETGELHFYPNEDATKSITPEEITGVNKVIKELEDEKEKVIELQEDVKELEEDLIRKAEEGAFDGKDALINGYNTIEMIEGENVHIHQEENVLTISADMYDDTDVKTHLSSLDELVDQNTKDIVNVTNRATNNTERLNEKDTQIANINQEIETAKGRLDGHDTSIEDLLSDVGDIKTSIEDMEGELTQDIARVEEIANSAYDLAEEAEIIAKGRATGYVFDTIDDMEIWIEEHKSELILGDNLYIRETNVPDFWWDGTSAQLLETQKVDLTEYIKDTDYATENKGGVIKLANWSSLDIDVSGNLNAKKISYNDYLGAVDRSFISKGTLENVIVGKGLITDSNYASKTKGGTIKINDTYALNIAEDGTLSVIPLSETEYGNRSTYTAISKGTLENIKNKYIKEGLVNNTIQLSDQEKLAIETWLGLSETYLTMTNEAPYQVTGNYNPAHKKYVDESIATALGTVEDMLKEV